MGKKRFLIVLAVISLFSMLFSVLPASAQGTTLACCVTDDSCTPTTSGTCSAGTYYSVACSQMPNCDIGCCCQQQLNTANVVVTTKKKCDVSVGQFFDLSAYTATTATYVQGCNAVCGLSSTCSPGDKLYCSDKTTVLATCTSEGKFGVSPGASCPSAAGTLTDTDHDGVPDSEDLCPKEPMLTVPQGTKETDCNTNNCCTDNIDNDCDGVLDCNDVDCCSVQTCFSTPTCIVVTCGNNKVDSGEECDDGNKVSGDGCSNICKSEYCGDGIVQPAMGEQCDFGDNVWVNCYAPNTVDDVSTTDKIEAACTLITERKAGAITQCNDGIDNDGDTCFDWPFDRGCSSESDITEDDVAVLPNGEAVSGDDPRQCTICGDKELNTPNSQGLNEDCDGSDSQCGSSPYPDGICRDDCTCAYECSDNPGAPDTFEITPVKGQFANLIEWQLHQSPNCIVDKMYLYKCSSLAAQCEPDQLIAINSTIAGNVFYQHKDKPVSPSSRYCYRVDVHYTTGAVSKSEVECITTGDVNCMANGGGEFCKDNVRYDCADDNFIDTELQNCSTLSTVNPEDFVCIGPFRDKTTMCLYQSQCALCNGLFGLFAIDATAIYEGPLIDGTDEGKGSYPCSKIPTCYNDTTRTTINKYSSCIDIQNCYDYTSESSCTENKCQLGECEWVSSVKAFSELGVGLCRPKTKELQNCSLCGDFRRDAQNRFYGDCDVEVCKLYGDCYYSYGQCGPKEQTGCWNYVTEEDCTYSNKSISKNSLEALNVSVNTQWGNITLTESFSKFMKVGGNNKLLQKSNDYFAFGLCKWIKYSGNRADVPDYICVKDADNNTVPDCNYGEESRTCQIDNIAPKTSFLIEGRPINGEGRLLLPKKIDLDYYLDENAKVYFCIADEDASKGVQFCYPNETSMCGLEKTFRGATGNYRLYYFAEDNAHNLENVSYMPVRIEVESPRITATATPLSYGDGNDYEIKLTSDRYVKCSGILMKGNGMPIISENMIKFEIDNEFTRDYYDLPDERYYFEYECIDYVGNVNNSRIWINGHEGVNTNRISNLMPYGPQNDTSVNITVQTTEDASCRYALKKGAAPGYESMTDFSRNAEGTFHTAHPSLVPNEYYEYVVKCKFGDVIEGNDNDMIRFSIDQKGPSIYPVTTFEAYDYDMSQTWGKDQEIRLQCKDDYFERVKKAFNMDYGCKDMVSYKEDVGDEYSHVELDENGLMLDTIPLTGTGSHKIYFVANDTGNNSEDNDLTININEDRPTLTINIFPYPMGPGSVPITGPISYGDYIVKVTSTKSLNDVNMSFVAGGQTNEGIYLSNEDFGKTYYVLLTIPSPGEGGLPKGPIYDGTITVTGLVRMPGSSCTLDKIDSTALFATRVKEVKIVTADPAVVIEPSLDNYDAKGYPLRKKNGIYYTNESRLYISGKRTSDIVNEVRFYVLNGDNMISDRASPQKVYRYDAGKNSPLRPGNPLNTAPIGIASPTGQKGSYTLNAAQNSNLGLGKYIRVTDANKERGSYGHYREHYLIDWIENIGEGVWKLTLKDPLENDLSLSDSIDVYSAPYPNEIFGEYIDLDAGNNTFFLRPKSVSGVMPLETESFIIFTDPNAPVVVSQTPNRGTTNNIHTPISIVVRENARESLVDTGSIKLMLDDQEIKDMEVNEYSLGSFIYYEISYIPPQPLNDGTYNVKFEGNDNAGHGFTNSSQAGPEWTFTMDTKAPSTPILMIENGTLHDGLWYVNRSPGIELEFPDEDKVNMTAIYKDNPFAGFDMGYECGDDCGLNNLYKVTFDPPLEPVQLISPNQMFVKDEFQIIVEAYKTLANRQKSPKGLYYIDKIVIDNITPEISEISFPGRIKVDGDISIKARIPNEFHDLNVTLIANKTDGAVYTSGYPLEQVSKMGSFYEFKWHSPYVSSAGKPPEVEQTFTLVVSDYAGNSKSEEITTTVDLQVPDIRFINISVTPTIEQLDQYMTKYTNILVMGNFSDDDVVEIFVIPGDYIPTQKLYENVSQSADIFGKMFMVNLQINGTINKTILNHMTLFIVDEAGYQVNIPLNIVADLEPPRVIGQPQWG
ncbi:hypothetical protein COV19_06435 [Candidatus Woesearchaeota archaeon CG10_big_fil_rev_8_21_14_0_10_44_13]|nr:MAG: hypothetical protein COV19_06435 [Candidatus Woesearchaeota archaeon CG10_big_fil_rev_8_21_14_0_10_44_13]